MTPQLQPFTLPATLYRYQPAPGYREGAGISAPLPGARSTGIRVGAGASRHRPGPLTDTPKDAGNLTFDGKHTLTFIGRRTTRTWNLTPHPTGPLLDTFTHPAPPKRQLRTPTNRQNVHPDPLTQTTEILYFQTLQRQTVEGLQTFNTTIQDPDGPPARPGQTGQTLTFTLENLLFNTPPTRTPAQPQKAGTARKAAFWAVAALALAGLTGNWLANIPTLSQQAGACDTPTALALEAQGTPRAGC